MRTLLITDFHLNSKVPGLLEAQEECIYGVIAKEDPDDIVIMGDVFMHRRPSPSELLAFHSILNNGRPVVILRGNHDSENRSDDGVTALSVFGNTERDIITSTTYDPQTNRLFIPHYEDQDYIIRSLGDAHKGATVFGHFGYAGCLNSAGDADFSLKLSHFCNNTFLGHIHGFCSRPGGTKENPSTVTCLGTPYTTNYGEAFKESFYAIIEDDKVEYHEVGCGPRHLVYEAHDVENNLDVINDPNYFTFLRVLVGADHHPVPYDKINVAYIDLKYAPVFNEEDLSTYKPDRDLFSINEVIISDYVEQANSTISIDTLMEGYRLLKDEN